MAEKGEKCWVVVNDLEHSTVLPAVVHEDLPSESMTIVEFEQPHEGRLLMKLGDHNVWFSEREAWEEARQRLLEVREDLETRKDEITDRIRAMDKTIFELTLANSRESKIRSRGYFIPGDLVWVILPDGVFQAVIKAIHVDWSASLQFFDKDRDQAWFELPLNQVFITDVEACHYNCWVSPCKEARELCKPLQGSGDVNEKEKNNE